MVHSNGQCVTKSKTHTNKYKVSKLQLIIIHPILFVILPFLILIDSLGADFQRIYEIIFKTEGDCQERFFEM